MKKWAMMLAAISVLAAAGAAHASAELAKSKACMACHAVEENRVGPSYRAVAAKYANQGDAASYLVNKIRKGGGGVWGAVAMPPNPQVTEAEAQALVKWILSL